MPAGRAGRLGIAERGLGVSSVLLVAVLRCGACLLPSSPADCHNELEDSRQCCLVHLSGAWPTSSQRKEGNRDNCLENNRAAHQLWKQETAHWRMLTLPVAVESRCQLHSHEQMQHAGTCSSHQWGSVPAPSQSVSLGTLSCMLRVSVIATIAISSAGVSDFALTCDQITSDDDSGEPLLSGWPFIVGVAGVVSCDGLLGAAGSWTVRTACQHRKQVNCMEQTNLLVSENNLSVPQNGSSPKDPCSFPQEA